MSATAVPGALGALGAAGAPVPAGAAVGPRASAVPPGAVPPGAASAPAHARSGTRPGRSVVGALAVAAVVAAALQSAVVTLTGLDAVTYADDGLVLLLVVAVLPRLALVRGAPLLWTALWSATVVVALLASSSAVAPGTALFLFRQVVMPALLIAAGLALRPREWALVRRVAIAVALVNGAYVGLELTGIRLLDPTVLAAHDGVWIADGLPGYYYGYDVTGGLLVRAGGLVLNPPIAGIVIITGAILLLRSSARRPATVLAGLGLVGAALATGSRAAVLIGGAALLLPFLVRRLGPVVAALLAAGAAAAAYPVIEAQGGSGAHSEGLAAGLADAVGSVVGRGFGYAGDYADPALLQSSESLSGIAFSAGGVLAVLVFAVVLGAAVRRVLRDPADVLAAIAVGALLAACFAETAGAINGTVPMWLACGAAFARPPRGVAA